MLEGSQLPTIDATRLRLRWLTLADAPALLAVFGEPEVVRFFGLSRLEDVDAAGALVEDIHAKFHAHELYQWGIALRDEDRVVGTCTLSRLDPGNRRAEIGFALAKTEWKRGYATEALEVLFDYAFGAMSLHRIEADVDPRNEPSLRRLEQLGFTREGYLRERWFNDGEIQDTVMYGLLAREWQARRAPKPAG